jgi:sulfonate transport system ATP-binding protein
MFAAYALKRVPVEETAPPPSPTTTDAAAVTLRGLQKSFGGKEVLRGIDLHIPAGQFAAIIGKSGCGKSTLLRLILGLDRPSAGEIAVAGGAEAAAARRIMFQEPRLLPWARVVDNVEIGLGSEGTRLGRRERAMAALAEVGLADRAGEWPLVLSGGQKQRVALARALVSRPKLLAFDEPLGALDALTRIEMQRLIEGVWRAQGFTAVLVTHDVTEAIALADRILVIDGGRIALDLAVRLPRPRRRGDPEIARLEGAVMRHLFNDQGHLAA